MAEFTFGRNTMLFPTPVLTYVIADAERVNAALLEEIAKRRKAEPGMVRSNRAGWHSETDFFSRKEPAHSELAKAIQQAAANATRRVSPGGKLRETLQIQIKGWINVNPPAAYNVPHDHPGSFWSGCYYIKTDGARKKNDEGGAITFIDPRCAPTGQPLVRAPVFQGSYSVQPLPGTLLLFPSNLKHWVHPNTWDQDRVTMAFNVFLYSMAATTPDGKKAETTAA